MKTICFNFVLFLNAYGAEAAKSTCPSLLEPLQLYRRIKWFANRLI